MTRTCFVNRTALLAAGLLGCSGGGSGPTTPDGSTPADASMTQEGGGAGDAGAGTDGTSANDGSDGATPYCPFAVPTDTSVCSGVELVDAPIVPTCIGSEPPVGQGGTVQDGRYVLQSIALYSDNCPPAAAETGQITWIVCGNDWATVDRFPGPDGGPYERQFDVVAATVGSQLTLTVACPPQTGTVPPYQYTATPGHFSLIYANSYAGAGLSYSFTEVDSFALQ